MSDLHQLSVAATAALRDAEAHGASVAAHFLRVQIHELFREARHHAPADQLPATHPLIRKNRDHG